MSHDQAKKAQFTLASRGGPEHNAAMPAATAALRMLKHHQAAWKATKAVQEAAQLANLSSGSITD